MSKIRSWLCVWEVYPILCVAAFLRFYQINTTEFDEDQVMVFRMAHDAIYHGLLPATSNIASIRIVNPPAVIYLLMLPAAFSANPLGGAVFVGLFNVIAVLLTYVFVRHYYGRVAAIIASLLYATATEPLYFSRFIWQQNLIAPFVVLFIFTLFRGVVDRRKGWLFPALLLLGILFQLHETTIILGVPLLVAILLAPGTIRWRDFAFGIASLLLIFSTYLVWEFYTKLFDLNIILHLAKLRAHFDNQALIYYKLFLSPYDQVPTNTHTLLYALVPLLKWLWYSMPLLLLGGLATAFIGIFPHTLHGFHDMWTEFRAVPQRGGFVLLLAWQIAPILILSRHSEPVFPYYLLLLMPGPFILIGLFLSKAIEWLKQLDRRWFIIRYGMYVVTGFVIIGQLLGSTATLIDETNGNIKHGYTYNTLNSLQNALTEAEQLALHRHLNHVYIATDLFTQAALRYLAEQMQTPTTLFDASHCLVLPNPTSGPAVLLVGPYDKLTGILLGRFAVATLIDQPERLGGAPFQLYIVQPISGLKQATSNEAFANNLQLLDKWPRQLSFENSTWLTTRWGFMRSALPQYRTTYTYTLQALLHGNSNKGLNISSQCVFTSMRAGDELLVSFQLPTSAFLAASMTISATTYTTTPFDLSYGPFHFENIRDQRTQTIALETTAGTPGIILSG